MNSLLLIAALALSPAPAPENLTVAVRLSNHTVTASDCYGTEFGFSQIATVSGVLLSTCATVVTAPAAPWVVEPEFTYETTVRVRSDLTFLNCRQDYFQRALHSDGVYRTTLQFSCLRSSGRGKH